jgi:hypothetical protein
VLVSGIGRYAPTGPRDWRAASVTLADPIAIVLTILGER